MYSTFLVFRQLLEITTVTLQRAIKTNYMCFLKPTICVFLFTLWRPPLLTCNPDLSLSYKPFGRVFTYCLAMYLLLL